MPRKFRLYHSKNSERKRRQKSSSDHGEGSGSGPSNESNTGSELPGPTNDSYSDCVASGCLNESSEQQSHDSAIISPSPGTDQSVAEGALHALRSSVCFQMDGAITVLATSKIFFFVEYQIKPLLAWCHFR